MIIKFVTLIQRKAGTTRAAFANYYEQVHAPLAARHFPFDKYVRNHLVSSRPADLPFDVYVETFVDRGKALGLLTGDVARVFDEDEQRFMNAPPRPEGFAARERLVCGLPRDVDPRGTRKVALFVGNAAGAEPEGFFEAVAAWGKGLGERLGAARVVLDEVVPGHRVKCFDSDAVLMLWADHPFTAVPAAPAGTTLDAVLVLDSQETPKDELKAGSGSR
ncbi:MAG: EthD domain-containing protein [Burkholderiales bacterium]|nr:EthD domain-containing protein [Burkholderiales bacterium]MDE1926209.1 EthD domain-containing protein [Burkholderiales bacterium]MDE2157977.1 EthD domain-containing protein [Burkholderiales bacterium]MDE2502839.1 EthD domain-containing protein [Burkholderiales bacterium]